MFYNLKSNNKPLYTLGKKMMVQGLGVKYMCTAKTSTLSSNSNSSFTFHSLQQSDDPTSPQPR